MNLAVNMPIALRLSGRGWQKRAQRTGGHLAISNDGTHRPACSPAIESFSISKAIVTDWIQK